MPADQVGRWEVARELSHMPIRERLADALRFIASPSPYRHRHLWGRNLVIAVLAVFALDFFVDFLVQIAVDFVDEGTGVVPDAIDFEIDPVFDLISLIILAPVIEEAAFRGWLSGRIAAIRFGAFGFIALTLVVLPEYLWLGEIAPFVSFLGLLIAFLGYIQWRARRDHDVAVPEFFTRHYHWFVWGSSVLFGLWHIGNYEPLAHPLGIIVLLPLIVGGMFLAYTRTRLGLRAAMLHHALYNGVWAGLDYSGIGLG